MSLWTMNKKKKFYWSYSTQFRAEEYNVDGKKEASQ